MIQIVLIVLGLCLGSFVNALVWRVHEQSKKPKDLKNLSIFSGRSMCPNCRQELRAKDLIPVLSWLALGGKCRYCREPISKQYPLIEILVAVLFVLSYIFWPTQFDLTQKVIFGFWLIFITGFVALATYDLRWYTLPNKIIYPLMGLAVVQTFLVMALGDNSKRSLAEAAIGFAVGGGLFYILFQISSGRWIGGGDVKLGALLGLIVGGPLASILMIFSASLLGTLIAIPLFLTGHAKKSTRLPFGPFLITAAIIVRLFGAAMITWYKHKFLLY